MKEIRQLTTLRGVFACWVMIEHIRNESPRAIPDPLWLIRKGYLAVDFFFFLSGFILAATYGARFLRRGWTVQYLPFMARRWGRLLPLHCAVVLAILALGPAVPLHRIVASLTLTERWPIWPVEAVDWINLPAWSISTEWAANLAFPAFVWAVLAGSSRRALLAAAAAAGLLLAVAAEHQWSLNAWRSSTTYLPLARCFGAFALGMAGFRFRDAVPWLKTDAAILGLSGAYLVALGCHANDLLLLAIMFPAVIGIAGSDGWTARALSGGPGYFLGVISYSIYLTHYSVLLAFKALLPQAATSLPAFALYVLGTIATVIPLSYLTYRLIEEPCREWVNRRARFRPAASRIGLDGSRQAPAP